MTKVVFGKPQASADSDHLNSLRIIRRTDPKSGKVTTMKVVNLDSETFGSDFQQVFVRNVRQAVKQNKGI